ncbi:unnamed protein product [Symbiodinium sp. CCMP2592]|nr:unnamed protein product [Symbiodinium sp. CCMP2592]
MNFGSPYMPARVKGVAPPPPPPLRSGVRPSRRDPDEAAAEAALQPKFGRPKPKPTMAPHLHHAPTPTPPGTGEQELLQLEDVVFDHQFVPVNFGRPAQPYALLNPEMATEHQQNEPDEAPEHGGDGGLGGEAGPEEAPDTGMGGDLEHHGSQEAQDLDSELSEPKEYPQYGGDDAGSVPEPNEEESPFGGGGPIRKYDPDGDVVLPPSEWVGAAPHVVPDAADETSDEEAQQTQANTQVAAFAVAASEECISHEVLVERDLGLNPDPDGDRSGISGWVATPLDSDNRRAGADASYSLSSTSFCGDATNSGIWRRNKLQGLLVSTGTMTHGRRIESLNQCDLQVCSTGTAANNLAIVLKQLNSIKAPTWDEFAEMTRTGALPKCHIHVWCLSGDCGSLPEASTASDVQGAEEYFLHAATPDYVVRTFLATFATGEYNAYLERNAQRQDQSALEHDVDELGLEEAAEYRSKVTKWIKGSLLCLQDTLFWFLLQVSFMSRSPFRHMFAILSKYSGHASSRIRNPCTDCEAHELPIVDLVTVRLVQLDDEFHDLRNNIPCWCERTLASLQGMICWDANHALLLEDLQHMAMRVVMLNHVAVPYLLDVEECVARELLDSSEQVLECTTRKIRTSCWAELEEVAVTGRLRMNGRLRASLLLSASMLRLDVQELESLNSMVKHQVARSGNNRITLELLSSRVLTRKLLALHAVGWRYKDVVPVAAAFAKSAYLQHGPHKEYLADEARWHTCGEARLTPADPAVYNPAARPTPEHSWALKYNATFMKAVRAHNKDHSDTWIALLVPTSLCCDHQPAEQQVAVAMVSLALAFSLMCLARSFVKELVRKETVERVAPAEEEVPELWYSPYGEKTHTSGRCHGLRNATSVHRVLPCKYCCPGGLRSREQRTFEYKRTFLEAAGKYFWLKVFMVVVLVGMSWFMVFEVNETYGYPLATNRMLNYRNKVLSLDNKNPKKKHVIKEITPADVNENEINVTSYLKKTNVYSEFYKNRSKGTKLQLQFS